MYKFATISKDGHNFTNSRSANVVCFPIPYEQNNIVVFNPNIRHLNRFLFVFFLLLFFKSAEFEVVISPALNKAENASENADMNNRDSYLDL